MGFMWVRFEKMEHHGQSKTKCEIDLIQFSLTKNHFIKDETILAMEGEEKGENFHTFLVSDDSGQVSDEIPFTSSVSCEEERVSSLGALTTTASRIEERKEQERGSEISENKIIKKRNAQ